MRLLDELRNLDVTDPGRWSARVSLTLGCSVFVLLVVLGLRFRTFGHMIPRLDDARSQIAGLEQQLAATKRQARAARSISNEVAALEERLVESGAWVPLQAQTLDLPVSLAAGPRRVPLEAIRPWEATQEFSSQLRQAGAELKLTGGYSELLDYLDFALDSRQLRELAELNIEARGDEQPGSLRATVRLLACFGGSGAAELLRTPPQVRPTLHAVKSAPGQSESLPSPFGPPLRATADGPEPQQQNFSAAPPRRGVVRVGSRQYELVEEAPGAFTLRSGG